jgi:hypothetical protein
MSEDADADEVQIDQRAAPDRNLRPVVFGGDGLFEDLSHENWAAIRDRAYENCGGNANPP